MHQWIRLNELYKLTESFFQILNSFLIFFSKKIRTLTSLKVSTFHEISTSYHLRRGKWMHKI